MVINSKENQISKFHQTTTCDYDKENEPKVSTFTKLETDVKSYETLVSELNKLSAEEQNIRNKLFTHNSKVGFVCIILCFIIIRLGFDCG